MSNENTAKIARYQKGNSDKTSTSGERTVIRSLALGGLIGGGAPCAVDVKDGKIIRVRPLHYDWKHDLSKVKTWKFTRNGKTIEPTSKSLPSPFSLAYKKRTYSPNRIKYPLKRVDWDPDGERNPQNRGISKFKRISWDEAATLVANEIKRMNKEYGSNAILLQIDGHGECKMIHAPHGCPALLLEKTGGFTQQIRNPDSWEGWYWGSKHVWGTGDVGMMAPSTNVVKDITEFSDMVLFWGCDPETTPWGFTGQFASRMCYFWKEAGIKQVYVCPDVNYGAAIHADKWIPILPNTDAAIQLAIIYTWVKEGTYDKEYIKTHTVGMDKVQAYVLGKEDGIPKTPEWASKKCGVPEWTIKALAREWAKKITSVAHYCGGSYVRGPYSHEPARLECILLGMQGLGKPGIHQAPMIFRSGMPRVNGIGGNLWKNPAIEEVSKPHGFTAYVATKQHIPKTLIHKAIPNPPVSYWGTGAIQTTVADQFKKYTYPIPAKEGGTEVHMIWTDSPCRTTCWNGGNETIEAVRNPKIECIVAQHPWLENDCLFADIVLPSNTTMEVEDIVGNTRWGVQYPTLAVQRHAIDPVGESKSDREVVYEIAKKLGKYEELSHGKTNDEVIRETYDGLGINNFMSWEDFCESADFYIYECAEGWENDPPGYRKFYEDPVKNPLPTPTGKLEFYSAALANNFPDDEERPPIPKWVEKSEIHDERISGSRAKMFPLLVVSNHGRWRVHSQCDDISWTREALTCKVKGWDGYWYEPIWINPKDAAARGIQNGDIVQLFNERGSVLAGALVWERIMPGAVSIDHGARVDPINPGKIDRGGAIDLIAPDGIISEHCPGQATSGFLVDIKRVEPSQIEEWRKLYPESFNREYDPASGLRFNGWVEGEK